MHLITSYLSILKVLSRVAFAYGLRSLAMSSERKTHASIV